MAKHLIDLDEEALRAAQAQLGTATIRETVNTALQRASERHQLRVSKALDVLASAELVDRRDAWR
jgi:Arc/MetJ family transcription regulator